jgi:hypothetical protein
MHERRSGGHTLGAQALAAARVSPSSTSAPNSRQASILLGYALAGITTVARIPVRCAAQATALPWLPELTVTTPAARSRRVQQRDLVPGTAGLESAGFLQAFELEPQLDAHVSRTERGVRDARECAGRRGSSRRRACVADRDPAPEQVVVHGRG